MRKIMNNKRKTKLRKLYSAQTAKTFSQNKKLPFVQIFHKKTETDQRYTGTPT